jgi:pimeloyl-ACP methyl ester carboxylesterase
MHTGTNTLAHQIDRVEYPFRSYYANVQAGRMHYIDEGHGQPILFVHGTPTWSFEWRHLFQAFSPTQRCIAPDFLGFGLSDRPHDFSYTPEAHGQNLLRFVELLDLRDLTLVVHDYGGPIGLPVALSQPERVKRVVLINTWMWSFVGDTVMEPRGRIAGGAFGRFLYRYANLSLKVIMPSAYADRRRLTPAIHKQYLDRFPDAWSRGAVLWPLARALLGSSSYFEALWKQREILNTYPSLIIWGMRDSAFQPYILERWRSTLPNAQIVQLAESGHWPHEEQPQEVITAMQRFLQ